MVTMVGFGVESELCCWRSFGPSCWGRRRARECAPCYLNNLLCLFAPFCGLPLSPIFLCDLGVLCVRLLCVRRLCYAKPRDMTADKQKHRPRRARPALQTSVSLWVYLWLVLFCFFPRARAAETFNSVFISEILADNQHSTLKDSDGDSHGW